MKKTASLTLLVSLFLPISAFALARAPFPNGKTLQPIPKTITPNVSGNVDATPLPGGLLPDQEEEQPQSIAPEVAPETPPSSESPSHTFEYAVAGLLAVVLVGFVWFRIKVGTD